MTDISREAVAGLLADLYAIGHWRSIKAGATIEALQARIATLEQQAADAHKVGFAAGVGQAGSHMSAVSAYRRSQAKALAVPENGDPCLTPDGLIERKRRVEVLHTNARHYELDAIAILALTPPDATQAAAGVLLAGDWPLPAYVNAWIIAMLASSEGDLT